MLKLTQHQDHYDKCVEKRLAKEYEWFIANLKQKGYAILPDLDPNRNGFQAFRKKADDCNYVLGMKPIVLADPPAAVDVSSIQFFTPTENKIPFGSSPNRPKQLGKNPPRRIPNTPNIHGFGIKLSLAGWKIFFGLKYDELLAKLKDGMNVEQIFDQHNPDRTILCNGERMSVIQACKTKGVFAQAFYRKVKGLSYDERQKVFDDMAKSSKPRIKISEQDLAILAMHGKSCGKSVDAVLHELISTLKTKRQTE